MASSESCEPDLIRSRSSMCVSQRVVKIIYTVTLLRTTLSTSTAQPEKWICLFFVTKNQLFHIAYCHKNLPLQPKIRPMSKFMLLSLIAVTIIFALIPNIAWLLSWIVAKCFHHTMPYAPFAWTAVGLIAFAYIVLGYGYFCGRFKLDINQIEYAHEDIPVEIDGYKIVHISDLHLSTFNNNHDQLQRFVDSINAQNPDLICFTGDLVTIGEKEAMPFKEILNNLKATDGITSVLGNHDFLLYGRHDSTFSREAEVEKLANFERNELGWHLLRNENFVIKRNNSKITIIGTDNQNCNNQGFKTISRGDLKKAMQNTDGFRILLTHDPSHWRDEVIPDTDIQLTLCGHTHAAQIKLFGWTPASWTFRDTDGLYEEKGQTMYINVGLGCTLPVRIGANAEITVITLKSK